LGGRGDSFFLSSFLDVPTFGYGIDPQDKGPGKAMSYGVKYGLLKALGLETGDDPERDSIEHKPSPIAEGNRRTGNKAIDQWVNEKLKDFNECETLEQLAQEYRLAIKHARESGCTEDQINMLTDQKDNRKEFLSKGAA